MSIGIPFGREAAGLAARRALAGTWIAAVLSSACSAPETCNEDYAGETLESGAFSGAATLAAAGAGASARFRAELTGLPVLWPATSAVLWSSMLLRLRQSYADRAADGSIEMPRVAVALTAAGGLALREPLETSLYPPRDGSVFTAPVFNFCEFGASTDCCPYGVTECSAEWELALERIDGEPYPPLELTWELELSAAVSSCPLGGAAPELLFEEVRP